MVSKQQLGSAGERKARRYLESRGYEFLVANHRTRFGEVDLVMRRNGVLVFVEVKTRRGHRQGYPEEAVTPRKLARIIRTAQAYRRLHRHSGPWQVDVVAVDRDGIRHVPNVTVI